MEDKILVELRTRKNNLVATYFQSETDIKYNTYTVQGDNFGGGGDKDSMSNNGFLADLANKLLGTYMFNDVKYLKQTKGKTYRANLYYFCPFGNGKPHFIPNSDIRIKLDGVKQTGMIDITQENLIQMLYDCKF